MFWWTKDVLTMCIHWFKHCLFLSLLVDGINGILLWFFSIYLCSFTLFHSGDVLLHLIHIYLLIVFNFFSPFLLLSCIALTTFSNQLLTPHLHEIFHSSSLFNLPHRAIPGQFLFSSKNTSLFQYLYYMLHNNNFFLYINSMQYFSFILIVLTIIFFCRFYIFFSCSK